GRCGLQHAGGAPNAGAPAARSALTGMYAEAHGDGRPPDYSFSLVRDERPLTEHVHLAFAAREDAVVRAFHAAALAAGYPDHGAPGERAVYHPPGLPRRVRARPRRAQHRGPQPQPGLSPGRRSLLPPGDRFGAPRCSAWRSYAGPLMSPTM